MKVRNSELCAVEEWQGSNVVRDDMWTSLRNSCPELKYIRSATLLPPDSQLFKFDNLQMFSLCLRPDTHAPAFRTDLWAMLRRCPDFGDIALHQFAWDPENLLRARWRRLRVLSVAVPPAEYALQCAFLAAHPAITHLTVAGPTSHGAPNGLFALEGLPVLVSFVGPFHHLHYFSGRPHRLPRIVSALRAFLHSRASTCGSSSCRPPVRGLRRPAPRVSPSPSSIISNPTCSAERRSRPPARPPRLVYVDPPPSGVAALPHALRALSTSTRPPCSGVAALPHALRAFAALRTLRSSRRAPLSPPPPASCAASRASSRCARTAQLVQAEGTYARAGGSDVFASERAHGLFCGEFASRSRMPLAEVDDGTEDAGTDEDKDAPLVFVLPRLCGRMGSCTRIYGTGPLGRRRGRGPSRRPSVRVRGSCARISQEWGRGPGCIWRVSLFFRVETNASASFNH
ncbi:hypothetical protein FB451DRAFT_1527784 [Mycena latifolia]|nr:hypothetical protein FB451DRAFT_1527784 [Mycena latifolia]